MLGKADATPMIAVKDLDRARKFYEETLGLSEVDDFGEGFMLKSGDTRLSVYRSEFAGTNKATALTFDVDDIESVVDELGSNGVAFEQYDEGPMKTDEKGIVTLGDTKGAFFKDPDGNTLGLFQ